MEPVIFQNHLCASVSLLARHGTEVHCLVGEPHEKGYFRRFLWCDEMPMPRCFGCETSIEQIKEPIFHHILHVGEKAHKPRHSHHEDQMEIGKSRRNAIEPLQTIRHELKQRCIVALVACGISEKLSQKQSDGQFVRMCGKRWHGLHQTYVAHTLQRRFQTKVKIHLHHGKRHEQLSAHLTF